MEVDALASAAGSGGVKREREEEEVGVKDSSPMKPKTVEGPAYPPPVPATTLTPGVLRHKLNPLIPSSGERARFLAVFTLVVHQGSRECDHDGYSVARRYHSRGSEQTNSSRTRVP